MIGDLLLSHSALATTIAVNRFIYHVCMASSGSKSLFFDCFLCVNHLKFKFDHFSFNCCDKSRNGIILFITISTRSEKLVSRSFAFVCDSKKNSERNFNAGGFRSIVEVGFARSQDFRYLKWLCTRYVRLLPRISNTPTYVSNAV